MSNDSGIKVYSIKTLLNQDTYLIPMYQRNYAWGKKEITQLIGDINDYQQYNAEANYYIGTLVTYVHPNNVYEVVDGQQRLTTLTLLMLYLKKALGDDFTDLIGPTEKWRPRLSFECRENSQRTLSALSDDDVLPDDIKAINPALINGYEVIKQGLLDLFGITPKTEKHVVAEKLKPFASYLFQYVCIVRTDLPESTDLNHYFEIMNSRGEQLEKHEVLKARLLSNVEADNEEALKSTISQVWEACANMNQYVQTAFSVEQRKKVFGDDYASFTAANIDVLSNALQNQQQKDSGLQPSNKDLSASHTLSIDEIIAKEIDDGNEGKVSSDDEKPERFKSIIDFPNFLLQVLFVTVNAEEESSHLSAESKDISFDDKKLIETFNTHLLKKSNSNALIKKFIFNLLRCRFLFDQYVIKADVSQTKRSLNIQTYKYNGKSVSYSNTFGDKTRVIALLQQAFHVSYPLNSYKYWLAGVLKWFAEYPVDSKDIDPTSYLDYLEKLARKFMYDYFLSDNKDKNYKSVILSNTLQTKKHEDAIFSRINYNDQRHAFIFNYLDYLIWKAFPQWRDDENKQLNSQVFSQFEFTERNSVEHFYPQHPKEGFPKLVPTVLHSLGNLCLIHSSKNSALSNDTPYVKATHFKGQLQDNQIPSLKLYLMIDMLNKNANKEWGAKEIEKHQEHMKKLLKEDLCGIS